MKNKKYALQLIKEKINGSRIITYEQIAELTEYSKRQIITFSKKIENTDIDSLLIHASKGKTPNNAASTSELEYIKEFKKQYPNISISQFMDIYHEDIIFNPNKLEDVYKFNLKKSSYSFFKDFYRNNGYKSPRKHRSFKGKDSHPLREPSPRRGILIMIDGTPHEWFENGKNFSLHLAIDDATGEIEVPEIESTVPAIEETNPVNENYQILNDFAFLTENSSLYDSGTEDKTEVEKIEKYQKVLRLSTDGNYDFVQTENMKYGYIESSKLEVLPELYVEVDLSDQTVELYKDSDIILTTLCVTGKDSTPTRIGYFPIKYKTYDTYLKGPGYNSHVYYWMPFDGGIGLHDAAWRDEFGGDIHFNNGSHGCVNMPHDASKTIYENVSTGTKVLVHN